MSSKRERVMQSARYDRLAQFAHHVLTVKGRAAYTEPALRKSLVASRVIDKNGIVRQERIEKWFRARGFKGHLPGEGTPYNEDYDYPDTDWYLILEGDSP